MNVIGLIAEYNPFHNGHMYQLNKIKEMYPDSIIIVCLNGYFTERGDISIMSKEDKVKVCLNHGIDIVIECPFVYGTQSADIYAYNNVKLLNEFGIDTLVFGSETDDINLFKKIALIQESDEYNKNVKYYLDNGLNYPTAMSKALCLSEDISSPNDLLAISYVKAINKINKNIEPVSIKRTNDYHDVSLDSDIVSASNIRERLNNKEDITRYLPEDSFSYIKKIDYDHLYNLLKFKILTEKDLSIYVDVDEGIDNRIIKVINESKSFDELVMNIKSKRYTYNKISRMLLHILIGLTKKDNMNMKLDYLKILGFSEDGQKYLSLISDKFTLPLSNKDSKVFEYEKKAAYIFGEAIHEDVSFDLTNKPIKRD